MKNRIIYLTASIILWAGMLACSAVTNLVATSTPVPTLTPIPTNTPTPAPQNSVFEETEFSRAGCFSAGSDEDVDRFAENEQFHMQVKTNNLLAWTICEGEPIEGDFILEADVTTVDGPENNVAGLIFRFNENTDEFYNFSIGADGYYVLTKDGLSYTEPTFLVEWNTSSAIKTGKTTNHLKVEVVGNSFKYYINDSLIGEISDSNLGSGNVGFIAGSFEVPNVHVSFDNLKVSKP